MEALRHLIGYDTLSDAETRIRFSKRSKRIVTHRSRLSIRKLGLEQLERRDLCAGDTVSTYIVGNSLTGNLTSPFAPDNRLSQLASAADQGTWNVEYNVRPGSTLTARINKPFDAAIDYVITPGESWIQHVTTRSDNALILQPFYGVTVQQELDAALEMIRQFRSNAANAQSRIMVYATWGAHGPGNGGVPFLTTWNRTDFSLDSNFEPSAKTFELFLTELRKVYPETEVIPAGHVFAAVVERINSPSGIPGLTSTEQLIGDGIHATNAGGYLAGLAAYTTMFGVASTGLGYPVAYQNIAFGDLLPATALPIVQQIASEVTLSHYNPKSARYHNSDAASDVNRDGAVTPLDALVIINQLNRIGSKYLGNYRETTTFRFDANGDNFVAPVDVLLVINTLNRQSGPSTGGEGESRAQAASYEDLEQRKRSKLLDDFYQGLS
jgi:hypothetical protein